MSISSLTNLQLNRLRGLNVGRGLFEKMYHLLLNQLSTKQTRRPKCRACSVRKIYQLLLKQLSTKQTQRPQCKACSVRKIYHLLLKQLSTKQTQRPQGACPARNYIPLLLNKNPFKTDSGAPR